MTNEPAADPTKSFDTPPAPDQSTVGLPGAQPAGVTIDQPSRPPEKGRAWPVIPGYEILQELGRGGMGVVYLARQASLKRLVALKMIRSGADASPEQLERFRVEGEAVARLQHPNIVQIFEVGEHEGNPFFALEYVDGGSLSAALAAGAWAPAAAAETVETLARAVHHAHQKSVVHRDLKPANVLLDADRVPKVTDFGLAKRLEEGDSGHTRTGAVMGTPSYMAPEQAAGRVHQIGPATDVYALGAILYECLTGRVPFKGDSVLDTLEQVRSADPVPPTKVRPGTPKDLETVCLKALAKEPAARYSSALAMAQDLERFRGGEPILGRRAGVVQKLMRKAKRNKAAVLAAAALLIAAGAVSVALLANRSSRELRDAEEAVAQGLERPAWDAAAGDLVEQDVARLTALNAERGQAARQKLIDRFADSVRADLKKPRVLDADVPGVEARLAWLAARDADVAKTLDGDLRARLRAWQPVAAVAAPFAAAAAVFAPGAVRVEGDRLIAAGSVVSTAVPSQGTIRLTVEFDGDWTKAAAVGVLFGHRPAGPADHTNGYALVLRPAWPAGDPDAAPRAGAPPSFEASDGSATLEILRDGVPLASAPAHGRPGPLRLTAEQDGDRLAVRLEGGAAVTFEDPVPLPFNAAARLALVCPAGTAIRRLIVEGQALPVAASRLERADDLFSRGQAAEALALYEAFAAETADADGKAEARCKAGMCLVQLDRGPDAAKMFEEVTAATNPRWGVIAAFQLWRLRLKAKQFEEADAALALIQVRFPKDTVVRYVPVSVRAEIDGLFAMPAMNWLVFDPKLIPQMESAQRLAAALQLGDNATGGRALALVIGYGLAGEYRKARALADEHLDAFLEQGHAAGAYECVPWPVRWHAWVGRLAGQTEGYGQLLGKHAGGPLRDGEDKDGRTRAFLPLRLESARNLAAAGRWDAAEAELDAYLADYPKPITNYAFHSQPYMMKGFARQRAGDAAGAQAAWKAGTYASFLAAFPPAARPTADLPPSRKALAEAWAMAALTDTLTDETADKMLKELAASFSKEEVTKQIAASLNISPAVMRGAWTSPRGKEWARRMAFLDLTPADYFWTAPRLLIYEKVRQDLLDGKPTADQDELLWSATMALTTAFRTGDVTKAHMFQLALAWKGTTNFLGWGGVAPKLKPEIRGPLAYVFGLRYRKLNKPAEAAEMFKTAAADAPAGSALKTLAEAERAGGK